MRISPEQLFNPVAPIKIVGEHPIIGGRVEIEYSIPDLISGLATPTSHATPTGERKTYLCLFLLLRRIDLSRRASNKVSGIPLLDGAAGASSLRIFASAANVKFLSNVSSTHSIAKFASLISPELGELRSGITWVGGKDPATAWLVPPPTSALDQLMQDLEIFLVENSRLGCPVAVCQMFFYQFIHIHPLKDGNGRLSRAWLALYSAARSSRFGFAMSLLALRDKRSFANIWSGEATGAFLSKLNACVDEIDHLAMTIDFAFSKIKGDHRCIDLVIAHCACGKMEARAIAEQLKCSESLAKKIVSATSDKLIVGEAGDLSVSIDLIEDAVAKISFINKES